MVQTWDPRGEKSGLGERLSIREQKDLLSPQAAHAPVSPHLKNPESYSENLPMRIALISDTHIPDAIPGLPSQLVERLQPVDLILHAGDLVRLDVLESLQMIAETIAVHGNMDKPAVVRQLPRKQLLTLAGRNIGLIHGDQAREIEREYLKPGYDYDSPPVNTFYQYLLGEFPEAEIIIFGHFHVPVVKRKHGCLLINPGSIAPYKGRSSFGILEIDITEEEVEIIEL